MSTVAEIEEAIRGLTAEERRKLAESLPSLVPELDGYARWEAIVRDPTPRPALTALGDRIEAAYRENLEEFPLMTDRKFDKYA